MSGRVVAVERYNKATLPSSVCSGDYSEHTLVSLDSDLTEHRWKIKEKLKPVPFTLFFFFVFFFPNVEFKCVIFQKKRMN